MNNALPREGEYLLRTRLEERMVRHFTPFLEALNYQWKIEAAEEYGDEAAKIVYKRI